VPSLKSPDFPAVRPDDNPLAVELVLLEFPGIFRPVGLKEFPCALPSYFRFNVPVFTFFVGRQVFPLHRVAVPVFTRVGASVRHEYVPFPLKERLENICPHTGPVRNYVHAFAVRAVAADTTGFSSALSSKPEKPKETIAQYHK
jgi:hypothetical protein